MTDKDGHLADALRILIDLGMPRAQQNDRSAVSLLALLDLRPGSAWGRAESPLIGITPIMGWARTHYEKDYAPNTRETFRRMTMHQMVDAGIALYNPDDPRRPVNSPKSVYQIAPPSGPPAGNRTSSPTWRYVTRLWPSTPPRVSTTRYR
jgi:hypothetical protein